MCMVLKAGRLWTFTSSELSGRLTILDPLSLLTRDKLQNILLNRCIEHGSMVIQTYHLSTMQPKVTYTKPLIGQCGQVSSLEQELNSSSIQMMRDKLCLQATRTESPGQPQSTLRRAPHLAHSALVREQQEMLL